MKALFDVTRTGPLRMKNRLVRSATRDGLADDQGHPTPELLHRYLELAKGGVGTIITGHAYVTDVEESKQPRQMGIYDDSLIEEYRELTGAVHGCGANIILQISCVGSQSYAGGDDRVIWGPSAVEDLYSNITPYEMTGEEIRYLQRCFAQATVRARKAGFDGVQLHAAHGYLISKFLSPYYNRRTDQYGGGIENRARFLFESYTAIRQEVGDDYAILAKINCGDFMEDGMTFDDCRYVCKALAGMGITAIEVSGGSFSSRPNESPIRLIRKGQAAYFAAYAARIAEEIDVPVILVGGNRDPEAMTRLLNETKIEYFSLSRPLVYEPDLVKRWQSGDKNGVKCVSCNGCLGLRTTVCRVAGPSPFMGEDRRGMGSNCDPTPSPPRPSP